MPLPALLGHIYRDELRAACREHDLAAESRSRDELAGRLLDAAGLPRSRDTIPPLLATTGSGDMPKAGDVVMVRRRNYLVDRVHAPVSADDATRVALICLDDDNQGRTEVLWELELGARVLSERDHGLGAADRLDPPRTFSAYYNALRWNMVTATDARLFRYPGSALTAPHVPPTTQARPHSLFEDIVIDRLFALNAERAAEEAAAAGRPAPITRRAPARPSLAASAPRRRHRNSHPSSRTTSVPCAFRAHCGATARRDTGCLLLGRQSKRSKGEADGSR